MLTKANTPRVHTQILNSVSWIFKLIIKGDDYMTNEEKKARLNRYLEIWADIEIKQQEIEMLRSRAEKITNSISPTPGGGNKQDFTVTIDRIISIQEKIDLKVQQAADEREYIGNIIDAIKSPLHRRVLQRKYINGDTFEQIAVKENKTFKHIAYIVHSQALEMISFGNDATK